MLLEGAPKFFLASNSADGFINGFKNAFEPKDGWRVYLIKGGPGTGKSSFMKRVAQSFLAFGEEVETAACSSDPDSLDAVLLKGKKIAIFDATAPHVLDPAYPGVCEEILNFGEFWNTEKLLPYSKDILNLTDLNKALHIKAQRIISAIGQLKRNQMKTSLIATDIDKTFSFAASLAARYIKCFDAKGKERVVYLSAITPEGEVFYGETIEKLCKEKIVLVDEYGTVSNIILSCIRDYALKNGAEIITVKNNLLPAEQIDHIIIPKLAIAFCSQRGEMAWGKERVRRIHASRFMDREILKESRAKTSFGRRLEKELIKAAVQTLSEAKTVHDKLESFYIKAMDFQLLNEFTREFTENLFLN